MALVHSMMRAMRSGYKCRSIAHGLANKVKGLKVTSLSVLQIYQLGNSEIVLAAICATLWFND